MANFRRECLGRPVGDFNRLDLFMILTAHGADDDAAHSWIDGWTPLFRQPSSEQLDALWKRVPCLPTTPPKVLRFLFIDLVQFFAWAELHGLPDTKDGASDPRSEEEKRERKADLAAKVEESSGADLDRNILAKLVELGEQVLADELRDHPVQFWLTCFEGWAEATSNVSAHLALRMEDWMSDLAAAAKECVTLCCDPVFPDVYPLVTVHSCDGQPVELPPEYRLEIPWLVLEPGLCDEPPRIWIRPNLEYSPLRLSIQVELVWPEMAIDILRLEALFDEVSSVKWTEAEGEVSDPGVTIVGKFRGHAVELGVKSEPARRWATP